ncbi:transglycosylase SLT domain-containing protein [Streptomyces sp. NPDC046197]|uniref:transglycosylase SLT domain-containing protein n=1 Tax=Streptomyces sp. NPDC046197 TaxID=3154337 RepID=UPI0033EE947E
MPANIRIRRHSRSLNKTHKLAVTGATMLGVAALAFSAAPSHAETQAPAAAVSAAPVQVASTPVKDIKASVTSQLAATSVKIEAIEAKQKAAAEVALKQKAAAAAAAQQKAEQARRAQDAASRSIQRLDIQPVAAKTSYGNNLDGWIRQALAIMKQHNIPGSYNGLHRNIMRESSGNPMAINNWDVNAVNGIPSKGLLQVIQPTFNAYHVKGTSSSIYDPVANIVAAANYAANKYGSIDNVNSAY